MTQVDLGSIKGPKGDSAYWSFDIDDNGELIATYEEVEGSTPPNLSIDDEGNMIQNINGSTMNLGKVVGSDGPQGPAGQGVPTGGTTGQILAKSSNTNYKTKWIDAPSGGGSSYSFSYDNYVESSPVTFNNSSGNISMQTILNNSLSGGYGIDFTINNAELGNYNSKKFFESMNLTQYDNTVFEMDVITDILVFDSTSLVTSLKFLHPYTYVDDNNLVHVSASVVCANDSWYSSNKTKTLQTLSFNINHFHFTVSSK